MRRAALFTLAAVACARRPEPPRPVGNEFTEVQYPPPPAQIEIRDEQLAGRPECRFVDGHYEWRGRHWQWQPGAWAIPPANCYYAPPNVAWGAPPNARLYYTPPRWYRADGKSCQAPVPCLIRPQPSG